MYESLVSAVIHSQGIARDPRCGIPATTAPGQGSATALIEVRSPLSASTISGRVKLGGPKKHQKKCNVKEISGGYQCFSTEMSPGSASRNNFFMFGYFLWHRISGRVNHFCFFHTLTVRYCMETRISKRILYCTETNADERWAKIFNPAPHRYFQSIPRYFTGYTLFW